MLCLSAGTPLEEIFLELCSKFTFHVLVSVHDNKQYDPNFCKHRDQPAMYN
jgi:hypothetical protein